MATKATIPFNFDDLYAGVQQKFAEAGYDTATGSNTQQLAIAMTYLASMLNTNTAVNINENILTLARKRKNILQDARLLGYEPGNKISYQYKLTINIPAGIFILPKYSSFTDGTNTFYYFGDQIQTNYSEASTLDIVVKEGNLLKSEAYDSLKTVTTTILENGVTKNQYYFDIPYTNIEDDGIECSLSYIDTDGEIISKEKWTKLQTFTVDADTMLNKQFYRLDNIETGYPRIFFKLPNSSDTIRLGTTIELNILRSSGSSGIMSKLPSFVDKTISATVSSFTLLVEGTEEETITSIKNNAPLFWNSANRAVTKNDYLSICNRKTEIDSTYVWDGNNEDTKKPGYIWFSWIPSTFKREFLSDVFKVNFILREPIIGETDYSSDWYNKNWFLEDTEISNIKTYLDNYKIPTMELMHRHPIYLDFEFNIDILKYDISSSESSQNQTVFDIINTYFYNTESIDAIENFEAHFYGSNLIRRIDKQTTDLTGINFSLKTDIKLTTKYIVNETIDDITINKIIIPLGLPFEDIYDSQGRILLANLPSINTSNFIASQNLTTDFSNLSLTDNLKLSTLLESDIKLGSTVVGKYRIFNDKYILIELNIDGVHLTSSNINNTILNVDYVSDNIKVVKNTIPRLKKVNFI